jgi:multisubunit Na+/H+ antiporter MnhB subunit
VTGNDFAAFLVFAAMVLVTYIGIAIINEQADEADERMLPEWYILVIFSGLISVWLSGWALIQRLAFGA